MPSVPKPPINDDVAEDVTRILDVFDEVILLLVECGVRYVREHPEVRTAIRHMAAQEILRAFAKSVAADDAEGES